MALAAVVVTTAVALGLQPFVALENLSLVFLTGVLLVAVRTAPLPACVTALTSALAYNFFFTRPHYTLYIHNTDELITVVLFLGVGLIAGEVAGRLRQQMQALRESHEQTKTLAELNHQLAAAADPRTMAEDVVALLARRLHRPTVILCPGEHGEHELQLVAGSADHPSLDAMSWEAAREVLNGAAGTRRHTDPGPSPCWRFALLASSDTALGVIGIHCGSRPPARQLAATLDLIAWNLALAMTRMRLATELRRAELAEETERLRSALLSSVSHDLRTPLASMLGAASTLRDFGEDLSTNDRRELADAIATEGNRLNRYIRNLLDMTRLGQGDLEIERDWIGVHDILNAALRRLTETLAGIRVVRAVSPDLPLLHVHPALIEQALVNVIENAARFSPEAGEIRIEAEEHDDGLCIRVSDQGPGIPAEERHRVFDRFFTGEQQGREATTTGLGLTICAGMVAAHMGRVAALPGPGGTGTSIVIWLPLSQVPDMSEVDES